MLANKNFEASMISNCNESIWSSLEEALFPPNEKGFYFAAAVIKKTAATCILTPAAIITSFSAIIEKVASYAFSFFSKKQDSFKALLNDSRLWEKINVEEELKKSPPGKGREFLFGTASCTYQDSGYVHCPNSQWKSWEKQTLDENNQSHASLNLFEIYQKDLDGFIEKLKALGVNSYRTSIEWSQIEPKEGEFDESKLDVYVNLCEGLKKAGIEPMITLHHFSEPKWFHDKGSFEKQENSECFNRFAEFVSQKLFDAGVKYFCTINEPSIEAFSRYVRGAYSPGVTFDFERAGKFLQGALKAHLLVYEVFKEKFKDQVQVGFTHQYLKFIPNNPLVVPATRYLTRLINDTVLGFLRDKTFKLKVPFLCNQDEKICDPETKVADFIGVQYYTRPIIDVTGCISSHSKEAMTQMPFREDPAGLYEAIIDTHHASDLPIIVTENGISTHDDIQRKRYTERALYSLKKAEDEIKKENLLGYYQWSLVDNLEWDMGMEPQAFGAYKAEKSDSGYKISGEPKPGIKIFSDTIAGSKGG